ncbi:MAG TPA: YfhO family protein [Vicinamibacterales bacterium]|nr:YfhO family protein [Vicinamibacterales bacterium]
MTFPWRPRRQDLSARTLLTLGALLPYWRLLTFSVIYVTDDYFASDIFNGELPGRVLVGQLVRRGELPVWTAQLCSGLPLAGSSADPIGLGAFALLPPAAALDLLVIALLLVAAHGAYGLARRFGADRVGAVLAGLAFAGSGYIACQLKHLAIVSTIVWLPVGLLLIDRALVAPKPDTERPGEGGRRSLATALFGLVFAQQVLSGFPQSAYICALVYGSFALFRALQGRMQYASPRQWLVLLGGLGAAVVLGAGAGAFVLLPMSALGSISDRAAEVQQGYQWATRLAYWPPNILTFLLPYVNGDISDNSYKGPPFFWEDYGYVGALTFLLAIYGAVRQRRMPVVLFLAGMTVLAYLFVLGAATPVFKIAYLLIPGLKMFRFPTRFLIVVELGLAVLGAIGLTRLRADLQERVSAVSRAPIWIAAAICALTAVDLWYHQPRQNPMVPAQEWLAPPATAKMILADTPQPRTFTPRQRELHRGAFVAAKGWSDVTPYFTLRGVLQPNTGGGFWGIPSADCYAGIAPRWYTDVWGDHNREDSLATRMSLVDPSQQALLLHPGFAGLLKGYGVTHVLSSLPQRGTDLQYVGRDGNSFVYRVKGTARVRFVPNGRGMSDGAAAARLLDGTFDPDAEILLHEPGFVISDGPPPTAQTWPDRAVITHESQRTLTVSVDAPQFGYLLLADTYYPGWSATVDGAPAPVIRANLSVRAVPVSAGRHEVRFTYDAPGVATGIRITVASIALLLLWAAAAGYAVLRSRRYRSSPIAPQNPITA